jgi:hypothetical protein
MGCLQVVGVDDAAVGRFSVDDGSRCGTLTRIILVRAGFNKR